MMIENTPIPSLHELALIFCNVHEVTILALQSHSRKGDIVLYRMVFCYLSLKVYHHRLCDLTRFMHRNHSTILKRVAKYNDLVHCRHPYEPLLLIYNKTKPALP